MRKKTRHKIIGAIGAVALFMAFLVGGSTQAGADPLWERFLSDFTSDDGRIKDYSQNGISHSEGQGYGMLLAVAYNDKTSFEKIWRWTENNLAVRKDKLFAWQWGERPNGKWDILDYNNATDGDILIAYALLKAGEKWKNAEYTTKGREIVIAMREKLAVSWKGRSLLLPGYKGFENGSLTVNPAYIILPAFRYFTGVDDQPFWDKIYKDGSDLLGECSFGRWGLPSDWIKLEKDGIEPHFRKSPNFGYGAVRVLLYLSFEQNRHYPKGLTNLFDHFEKQGYIPLTVDLERNSLSLTPARAGFYAIYALAAEKSGKKSLAKKLRKEAEKILQTEKKSYYSFVLYLLANKDGVFE